MPGRICTGAFPCDSLQDLSITQQRSRTYGRIFISRVVQDGNERVQGLEVAEQGPRWTEAPAGIAQEQHQLGHRSTVS